MSLLIKLKLDSDPPTYLEWLEKESFIKVNSFIHFDRSEVCVGMVRGRVTDRTRDLASRKTEILQNSGAPDCPRTVISTPRTTGRTRHLEDTTLFDDNFLVANSNSSNSCSPSVSY